MSSKSTYTGLGLYLVFALLPFVLALGYALLYSLGIVGAVADGFTLDHYSAVLSSGRFLSSLLYSMAVALVALVISVSIALAITIRYHAELGKGWISFLSYVPLCIPGVVAAFYISMTMSKAGILSSFAAKLGLIENISSFPDLTNDQFAIGIIASFVMVVMPFFVLVYQSIYSNEGIHRLSTLSQSLGATTSQTLRRVTLPLLWQKSKRLVGLYYIFLIGAYEAPLILGRENPQMLSVLIIRELKQYDLERIAEGYVIAVLYTIVVSGILLVSFRSSSLNQTSR